MNGVCVYCREHLRDGIEEWAKLFDNIEGALKYANEMNHGFYRDTVDIRMFHLGDEIPIKFTKVEEPQPPKVTTKVELEK